jgi:CDP-diacylglycerol pyrophosphatase
MAVTPWKSRVLFIVMAVIVWISLLLVATSVLHTQDDTQLQQIVAPRELPNSTGRAMNAPRDLLRVDDDAKPFIAAQHTSSSTQEHSGAFRELVFPHDGCVTVL